MLTFPARQFESFSRKDGISTEASNLRSFGLGVGEFPQSFYLLNEDTGVQKLFLLEEVQKDNEGDIQCVKYFHPGDARIPRATLWND